MPRKKSSSDAAVGRSGSSVSDLPLAGGATAPRKKGGRTK